VKPDPVICGDEKNGTTMFAVIKTGGKQYRVAKDDIIKVEKLDGDAGAKLTLGEVLMVGDDKGVKLGTPLVDGASVSAEVVEQTRGDKIIVFKKKRRHNYRRKKGHRQDLTVLKITGISAAKKKAAAKPKPEAPKPEAKVAAKPETEAKATEAKAEPKAAAKPKAEAKPKTTAEPKAATKSEEKD
jgi:large subunit ribosomal protein L21